MPHRALAALLFVFLLTLTGNRAQTDDPPPSAEDLLTLPGPEEGEGPRENGPFQLVPTLPESIRVSGDYAISYDAATETVRYQGGLVNILADNGIQLFARDATIDLKNKFIRFTGDVSVYQGAVLHRGETAVYHYEDE
ncbi:MAG: hypothetical protein GWO24_14135, partial [Akkermansiaceae bacterium]|nr:hypothetical protein [Akkermansiaceae bacterium]